MEREGSMGPTAIPDVQYAETRDGVRIAYSLAGGGPPLVYVRGLNSHAQENWVDSWRRAYLAALARAFTVIVFDARGNGLSDPIEEISLEALVEDLRAVVDDLGLERFVVHGQGFGSPIALAYTAQEPERVDRLILYCAYSRGRELYIPDFFMDAMRERPVVATMIMGHATYPDSYKLPGRLLTPASLSATPAIAVLYFELARMVDVSALVPSIRVPTLVMQPKANRVVPLELGEEVAASISGAQLVRISSGSYNPWAEGAIEPSLIAVSNFVGRPIPLMPTPQPMAVLVTDLVGSTEMTHRLGEERARELFRIHDDIVRRARTEARGTEVKHTGDGIMCRFDSTSAAIRCAVSIQERLAERNRETSADPIHVRIGIAFGDVVEERDDTLFGTTVVLAVRIMDHAEADQILVSGSVRESEEDVLDFSSVRTVKLKGFPDPVSVYELRWAAE